MPSFGILITIITMQTINATNKNGKNAQIVPHPTLLKWGGGGGVHIVFGQIASELEREREQESLNFLSYTSAPDLISSRNRRKSKTKIQEITHKTLHGHMETDERQHQIIHTRHYNKRQSKISSITMNSGASHCPFQHREREREFVYILS